MAIKITPADKIFSQYIRLRDKQCVRCHSAVRLNPSGLPISHTNSHYYGRGKQATRFDPENCDTLCYACHTNWGSNSKEDYKQFKINQLGEKHFDLLTLRANSYHKKDYALAKIQAQALLKEVL